MTRQTIEGDALAEMERVRSQQTRWFTGGVPPLTAGQIENCYDLLTIDGVNVFQVCWTINVADQSITVSLRVFGWIAGSYTLDPTNTCVSISEYPTPITKLSIEVCVDWNASALTLNGEACCWWFGSGWACEQYNLITLAAWNPTVGQVGGDVLAHPPQIDFQGETSYSIVPTITRINVDDYDRIGTNVGSIVKKKFFADYEDFIFNVCFAVGPVDEDDQKRGQYGNPTSVWFNVFAGYYQLDVPTAKWKRPFAYAPLESGKQPVIVAEDIVRIAKADWNYFSNWMYGVPDRSIEPFDGVNMTDVTVKQSPRTQIGSRYWDVLDVDMHGPSAQMVSGYVSKTGTLVMNSTFTPAWWETFGWPLRDRDAPSFIGTNMLARMYISFYEEAGYFSTVIFGGTANKQFSQVAESFLNAQMEAIKDVILGNYQNLGFASGSSER